jgi:hypothetical protein
MSRFPPSHVALSLLVFCMIPAWARHWSWWRHCWTWVVPRSRWTVRSGTPPAIVADPPSTSSWTTRSTSRSSSSSNNNTPWSGSSSSGCLRFDRSVHPPPSTARCSPGQANTRGPPPDLCAVGPPLVLGASPGPPQRPRMPSVPFLSCPRCSCHATCRLATDGNEMGEERKYESKDAPTSSPLFPVSPRARSNAV